MTFYKAVRPDGTDFYSATVDYAAALASGEPTPALSGEPTPALSGDVEFPGPGWYHLATVPTACAGMSWPCRLFEVEPVGDVFMDNSHPHKIGCRAVRVLAELPAHEVFGPQGEQVAALIERFRTLSGVEVDRLADAWYVVRGSAGEAAGEAARDAAWVAAGGAAWYVVRGSAGEAARDAAWVAAWYVVRGSAGEAARDAAWVAAWDAAAALVVRDLIGQAPGWDQDAYDLLTGPWRDVIGPVHPDDPDWTETP